MKRWLTLLTIAFVLLSNKAIAAEEGFPKKVVGYYNYHFYVGDNLFHNNLSGSNNLLSTIFNDWTPIGTTVSVWNSGANAYTTTSEYLGLGQWTLNLSLAPGTGARLSAPVGFTNTFIGDVVDRRGGLYNPGDELIPPLPFGGPNGWYLWGDQIPIASSGSTLFQYVVGRLPNAGEQIVRLDAASQTYITSTFQGGSWNVLPTFNVGDAAFFNIGPVPEPSAVSLTLLAFALLAGARKGRF